MAAGTFLRSNPLARQINAPRGFRMEWVPFSFPTTALTCTLAIPGFNVIEACFPQLAAAPGGSTISREYPLGTLSASGVQDIIIPTAGVITAANIVADATVAASDSTYWSFGLLNKTQTLVPVDITAAANTSKATGGSAITAFTVRALTLGNAAACAVAAQDVLQFTETKTSTPGNLNGLMLQLQWQQSAGGSDEEVYWADTLTAAGVLIGNTVTIGRKAGLGGATSGLKGIALVLGR